MTEKPAWYKRHVLKVLVCLIFVIMSGCLACLASGAQVSVPTKDLLNDCKFVNDEISDEEYKIFSLVLAGVDKKELLVDKDVGYSTIIKEGTIRKLS